MSDLNDNGNARNLDSGYPTVQIKPVSEEQAKLSSTRTALFHTALIAVVMLIIAFWKAEDHPDTALFLMMGFVFLGLYVFVGTMETTLLRNLIGLRASLIGWVAIFACFAWVAKSRAVSEVNAIFHVDPSLLPMTLVAVTMLQVMSMLFWPVIVTSVLILFVAYIWRKDFAGSHDGLAIVITLVISAVAQVFFALLVWGWVESGSQRTSTIYRIAHFSDFNSSFRCQDLDETQVSVLFVDPDKAQVIFAPKIPDLSLIPSTKATWLQRVEIPKEFPQVACVPNLTRQESGE
jgi:hypothetical protein